VHGATVDGAVVVGEEPAGGPDVLRRRTDVVGVFPTATPSSVSLARSWPNSTTNGPSCAATWAPRALAKARLHVIDCESEEVTERELTEVS
jgi:hypothetical protein